MLSCNTMPQPFRLRLEDPLSLSAGALSRLGWGAAVSAILWGAVVWAMAA